ncbi:GDSL-type esterase/lipase family protein [Paractinoplanes atraurantiacus]|uniref:Lysophospholipase L1 n=1 Tax=Paractinoplanes atraurantiacus TaxID=1036182 RepID=A0A285J6Y3_9ACTN|nr:GDSL-type esterase/lipase family protein [Actinoplanes atraurantiacus]SNY54861.1 Lysophospholipase L1 [Actinoplanes atraurantiacus]
MTLRFAILGDSIAYGQGAATRQDTVAARLSADLTAHGVANEPRVFAVPGAQSRDLPAQARPAVSWRPDVVLIIIGANDLTRFVPPAQAVAPLTAAVRTLRTAGSEVVVAPAPDLSVVPWVPAEMRALVQAGSRILHDAQTRAVLAEGAHVADIGMSSAAGFAGDLSLFSADRFHPSSAGYAVIAAALAPAIRQAASVAAG